MSGVEVSNRRFAAADPRFQERALERRRRPWRRALWVLGSLLGVGSLVWLAFWSPVLAVRSSSIVIATLLAGRLLAEHVARRRIAGSILVFAGVALLAV